MQSCLGDLNLSTCLIYLDDVVDFPPMLERLEEGYGFKLGGTVWP